MSPSPPDLDTDGVMADHRAPGPQADSSPAPGVSTLTRRLIQRGPGAGQVKGAVSVGGRRIKQALMFMSKMGGAGWV